MKKSNQLTGSPIHILVVSPFFHPHIGGSQRYIEELYVRIMKDHPNVKVTVLTYNTDGAPEREVYRKLSIVRIPCWSILPGQFALPNPLPLIGKLIELSSRRFDYVHTQMRFFDTTWWSWIYAKLIHATSIFTEHVATHPTHEKNIVRNIARFVDKTIGAWSIGQYDLVTVTNTPTQIFLKQTLRINTPVHLSYGGIDTTYFSPSKRKVRRVPHIGISPNKKTTVVTFAGRIIQSKGVMAYLQAIESMKKTVPKHVQFVIGGDGELFPAVKRYIHAHNLGHLVKLTGALTRSEMRTLLRATDIFVHPSQHSEGFPNAILEAGASQCYVIATDNAGSSEIIRHAQTGAIIRQKQIRAIVSAIQWSLDNPKSRREMAASARTYIAEQFDWNVLSREFYSLLLRAATGSRITIPDTIMA